MATATTASSDFTVPYTGYITLSTESTENSYSCCGKELSLKVVSDLLIRTHLQTIFASPIFGHKFTSDALRDFHTVNHRKKDYLNCKHRHDFLATAHKLAIAPNKETAERQKKQLNKLSLNDCALSKARVVRINKLADEKGGTVSLENQAFLRQLSFEECLQLESPNSSFDALQVTYFISADNSCLGSSVELPFITFFNDIPFLPSLIKNQLDIANSSNLLKEQRHNSEPKVPSSIPPPYNPQYMTEAQPEESIDSNSDDTFTVEPTAPPLVYRPSPEHNSSSTTPCPNPTPNDPISRELPPAYSPGNYFDVHPEHAKSSPYMTEHKESGKHTVKNVDHTLSNSPIDSDEWLLVEVEPSGEGYYLNTSPANQ
ncbi:hypothetical protein JQC92_00510 [Shewanella sp. 202IG2-18]|uniref:hypothetical protein n=1 Tax=Parashewanella hymeniacidonis TaxID=2807618 RepID=UPI00195F2714|nr:hypothetical protein [Parashewanella hymeniacidonis]MBM7070527.1 hypothetical protein [Parashewanella hymeniacidonis]